MAVLSFEEKNTFRSELEGIQPFSLLTDSQLSRWFESCDIRNYEMGSRLLRPDQLPSKLIYTLSGTVRILGISPDDQGQITLAKQELPELYGWLSLLRAQPSEFIQCSTNVKALIFDPKLFIQFYKDNQDFAAFLILTRLYMSNLVYPSHPLV